MAEPAGTLLVFSKVTGYRHDSIPAGVAAVRQLLGGEVSVDATEDSSAFTAANLSRYQAVVFLNPSGTVLNPPQRAAFEAFIRNGGGFAGIHSASACEYDWPCYGELAGAWFDRHPEIQPARIRVEDAAHPATARLPAPTWPWTDEWYDFRTNPRSKVRVLLTVDESSYEGGQMGADHPIAWCHTNLGGRAFYTALGHAIGAYGDPAFRAHMAGGIRWAAGLA